MTTPPTTRLRAALRLGGMRPVVLALTVSLAAGACRKSPSAVDIAPPPPAADGYVFSYTPPRGAPVISAITVPGTFNDWSTTATPMTRQANGSWRVRVPAVEGVHEYKFFINGAWVADMCRDLTWGDPARDFWIHPGAQGCVADGNNGRNAVADLGPADTSTGIGFRHDPRSAAQLSAAAGRLSIRFRAREHQVRAAALRSGGGSFAMHLQLRYLAQEVWRGTLPDGTTSYTISVQTATGSQELGPFAVPPTPFRAVPWVGEAVGYQIFPERFWNGDPGNDSLTIATDEYPFLHPAVRGAPPVLTPQWDGAVTAQHCCHQYFGGDLQGIIDRLDHLQSLGVTLLYLNPIFSSGSAHGYDVWDYLQVEPSFGDEALLRALLQQARGRGMRLMWDFVPNHVGVGHPAFQEAVRRGAASPYWRWFTFRVPAGEVRVGDGRHYATFAGVGALPKLDTGHPAVREHLLAAVRRWTGFGFDGIRVDVPNELSDGASFFRAFRAEAKAMNPDVYLVGEIWRRAPHWVQGDQFDALMNYAVGQDVIERFVKGEVTAAAAMAAMAQLYAEYPEASSAMQFNVISTHDNSRLLTKLSGEGLGGRASAESLERQRLASAMLYSLPGVPVTFQGDECAFLGAGGGGSREENRYPVQWASCDRNMVAHYRELARLKRALAALASPVIRLHRGEGAVLSYFRGEAGAGELLVLLNAGSEGADVALPEGSWADAVSGDPLASNATVGARGWRYLRRR